MTSKIGIGLIGCGAWGSNHARIYNEIDNAYLVGVLDINPITSINISNKYPNCKSFPDLESMLSNSDIDAVSICTPTNTHYPISRQAINSSKHCLIEKPVTNSVEQATELKKIAEEKNVQLQAGFIERFNPAVKQAVRMVKEGFIGKLVATHHRRLSPGPKRKMYVGVISDIMIHEFDIASLFGKIVKICGETYKKENNEYEVYALSLLEYDNKGHGCIESSLINPSKVRSLDILGESGCINIEYLNQDVYIQRDADNRQIWFHKEEPLKIELESFVNNIINNTPVSPNINDGINTLKICESFRKSSLKGLPLKVEY